MNFKERRAKKTMDPRTHDLRKFYVSELESIEQQIKAFQKSINSLSDKRGALEVGMEILEKYDGGES